MSTVISVENVSKTYRLGAIGGGLLREDFSRWWARLRGRPDPTLRIGEEHKQRNLGETFWALRNVSFEVKDGEILGIIGRNGAGKSTLLKILSRVTGPTEGRIRVKGRIASLLEVGTGFHPELTGRENTFLNGAILGMTKTEIRSKFDEIVAFSELDQFIDTPVKRYSSGMYVRLAFGVAAHLEPEILIVDEVLAVGDAAFQKKCLGKMGEVARTGRTVLLVTHNIAAVHQVCTSALLLTNGAITIRGSPRDVADKYMGDVTGLHEVDLSSLTGTGDSEARLVRLRITDSSGVAGNTFGVDQPFDIEVVYDVRSPGTNPQLSVHFRTNGGETAFASIEDTPTRLGCGRIRATLKVPPTLLNSLQYTISVYLATSHPSKLHGSAIDVAQISIEDSSYARCRAGYTGVYPGVLRPHLKWLKRHETPD